MQGADDPKARRNRDLALIHIAKKELGLDEEAYRGLLVRLTGRSSARDLSEAERRRVLDYFEGLEGTISRSGQRRRNAVTPMQAKIRYLWRDLHRAGGIADKTDRALDAFVRRMTGVASLRWLNTAQSTAVLEALKSWLRRVESGWEAKKKTGGATE